MVRVPGTSAASASSKASHSALLGASGSRDPPAELWINMQLYEGIIFSRCLPEARFIASQRGIWTYRIKYRLLRTSTRLGKSSRVFEFLLSVLLLASRSAQHFSSRFFLSFLLLKILQLLSTLLICHAPFFQLVYPLNSRRSSSPNVTHLFALHSHLNLTPHPL